MAVYFYASDVASDAIRAASGVKGFLFPESEVEDAFRAFWEVREAELQFSPKQAYAKAVDGLRDNRDFGEELDHFSIIEKSATARALFIWNVVCRMAYSANYDNPKKLFGRNRLPIHTEIVRYSHVFTTFFMAASPLLEESYDRRSGQVGGHSGLHAPDMRAAGAYLDRHGDLPSHEHLAAAIDDCFLGMWRARRRLGVAPFYRDAKRREMLGMALMLTIFRPVLTSPKALGLVLLRFVQLLRRMGPALLGLLRTGRNAEAVGELGSVSAPAILGPRGQIDPVGFLVNRGQWGSMERACPSEDIGRRANLLWHVLNRCAETAVMMRANMGLPLIERQYAAQWDFFGRGFVPNEEVRDVAYDLDTAVVDRINAELKRDPLSLSNYGRLAEIGLSVFHDRAEPELRRCEAMGLGADFAKAFNITYMQV